MTTKFDKQVRLGELTQMRLTKKVLVTSSRQDHVKNSTTRVSMVTKLGSMVTYLDRLVTIKS